MSSRSKETVEKILSLGGIKVNGNRPFDMQVHDERFYNKALTQRELGIGEAYMDGWWSSKHLDETITKLLTAKVRRQLPLVTPFSLKLAAKAVVGNGQKIKRSYKNAAAHYNIGNDLYERMLDKRMIYTCAFWEKARTLDEAQEAKLDRVCKKLQLKKGMTVLDIGCGWGGFARYAAEKYGVKVTGITLAEEQLTVAIQRNKGLGNKFLLKDYREIKGKFDRVLSIGMMEAVGLKNLKTFFTKCSDLLKDDGIMLHHFIGKSVSIRYTDPWYTTYIFPGGYIPSLTNVSKAVEGLLLVEDLENFGPDYDKTLMAWYKNFVKAYPKLKNRYDERFYRMWEYYLMTSAAGFRSRELQLWQMVFRKIRPAESYRGYR